jgi:SRSO17 transposase
MVEEDIALTDWLKPFVETLGHKKRRQMCPVYISGLIGPSDRKSIEPMAERLAPDNMKGSNVSSACDRINRRATRIPTG